MAGAGLCAYLLLWLVSGSARELLRAPSRDRPRQSAGGFGELLRPLVQPDDVQRGLSPGASFEAASALDEETAGASRMADQVQGSRRVRGGQAPAPWFS